MYCPKCGKENPDDVQLCSSCSSPLRQAAEKIIVKTSKLAIASFILGILSFSSFWLFAITPIPALILGIISLVQIEKGGGRLTGRVFAIVGIVVPVVVFFLYLGILIPALRRVRETERRMTCGMNLRDIGKAMLIYAKDYEDQLPRAGGRDTAWGGPVIWDAPDRFQAYNLQVWTAAGGQASISSNFYLLVKYAEATPKLFICKGDSGATEFKLSDYPNRNPVIQENIDAWDFGPQPWKHCSYTYHIPYSQYALTTSSEPGMAVAADRNPWIASPSAKAKTPFTNFQPDLPPQFNGTTKQARYGNAITHKEDGQNVLFMDSHVDFEKRAWCGIEEDNIYTLQPATGIGHPQLGGPPLPFVDQPGHRKDSLLVHDPPVPSKK